MTTITALPDAPSRSDPATFSDKADAFVAALPTFGTQCNAVASEVNGYATNASNSAAIAIASANFKGNWSSLTGSLAVPASVLHSSQLWLLVSNVADVTAHTPGVSASWVDLDNLTAASRLSTPRTIALSGKATGTATAFDGTANITIPVTATNAIGDGQTWQDVVGSRALDTNYTNSSGRPIMVSIGAVLTENVLSQGYVYVDSLMIAIISNGDITTVANHKTATTVSFIVPNGSVYKLQNGSGVAISTWTELR